MKKANLILIIPIVLLVLWNNYYPTWIIAGTYVSNNNDPVLEGPSSIDTLTLFENGTFKNGAWGEGLMKLTEMRLISLTNIQWAKPVIELISIVLYSFGNREFR